MGVGEEEEQKKEKQRTFFSDLFTSTNFCSNRALLTATEVGEKES